MPESKKISSKNEVEPTKWHHKSISELFGELRDFFEDLFDLKDGMDERGSIINIINNKEMKGANAVLLMCSIMVASLGLDLNSPAVIIGAMLISPLMSPILGVGLGFGINDRETLLISLQHFFLALVIALITSYLYFKITPFGELTNEIKGRTAPNLLDGLVAIFGGTAGIISITRKDKSNAIPGVAIATALMPPLCVAGYGLAKGEWEFFLKAFYLFFLNSFFIAASTYVIIRLLGFRYKEFPNPTERRRNTIVMALFSFVILLPAILVLISALTDLREKQDIQAYIEKHFENENTAISNWEPRKTDSVLYVDIQLIGLPVPQSKIDSCDKDLDKILGKPVTITTYQSREIPFEEIQRLKKEVGGFKEGMATQIDNLQKLQTERELKIEELTKELDSIQNEVVLNEIFAKTRISYPLIDAIGFAKDFQQTDFVQQNSSTIPVEIPILLVKWNPKKSKKSKIVDQEQIRKLMQIETKLDTLLVVAY